VSRAPGVEDSVEGADDLIELEGGMEQGLDAEALLLARFQGDRCLADQHDWGRGAWRFRCIAG